MHSQKLLTIIHNKTFEKEFVYFDVMKNKSSKDVLYLFEVTNIPSIYVDGRLYEGTEAFEWLESKDDPPPLYSSISLD
jgi:glutaredoxin-related protein